GEVGVEVHQPRQQRRVAELEAQRLRRQRVTGGRAGVGDAVAFDDDQRILDELAGAHVEQPRRVQRQSRKTRRRRIGRSGERGDGYSERRRDRGARDPAPADPALPPHPPRTTNGVELVCAAPAAESLISSRYSPGASLGGVTLATSRDGCTPASRLSTSMVAGPTSRPSAPSTRACASTLPSPSE